MLFIVHSSFIPYFGKSAYSQQEEILKFVLTVSVQLFMIFYINLKTVGTGNISFVACWKQ